MSELPTRPTTLQNPPRRWWRKPLIWSILLSAGLLVYEVTADPFVGMLLVCTRFGWQDCMIAYRLWRIDPNCSRRRSMSWIFVGYGLAKTVVAAWLVFVAGSLALTAATPFLPPVQARQALGIRVISAVTISGMVFPLACLANGLGFWSAYRASMRVWVDFPCGVTLGTRSSLAWRLRIKDWQYPIDNVAGNLLYAGLAVVFIPTVGTILGLDRILDPQGVLRRTLDGILITVFVASIVATVAVMHRLLPRLIATTPAACWGTDVIGSIMSMKVPTAEKSAWLAAIPRMYWRSNELAGLKLVLTPDGDASPEASSLSPERCQTP